MLLQLIDSQVKITADKYNCGDLVCSTVKRIVCYIHAEKDRPESASNIAQLLWYTLARRKAVLHKKVKYTS